MKIFPKKYFCQYVLSIDLKQLIEPHIVFLSAGFHAVSLSLHVLVHAGFFWAGKSMCGRMYGFSQYAATHPALNEVKFWGIVSPWEVTHVIDVKYCLDRKLLPETAAVADSSSHYEPIVSRASIHPSIHLLIHPLLLLLTPALLWGTVMNPQTTVPVKQSRCVWECVDEEWSWKQWSCWVMVQLVQPQPSGQWVQSH